MKLPFWPNPSSYHNIELGLSRVYQLLMRLDNPHLKLPPTIHIAGTNGKGSTQAFLRAIFEEAGLKVHSYTSPHLVNFNERILLAGKEISDEFLNKILEECKAAAEKSPVIPVTFFEGITVAAFLAFSRVKADVLLLEVGMGGRLDATNVLPEVLCSIITPISFDHQDFLGDSLEKIAFEKAGIIKKNCPVIVGKQTPEILKTIAEQAAKNNAKIFSSVCHPHEGGDPVLLQDLPDPRLRGDDKLQYIDLPLIGQHQKENAATAATAALVQKKFSISEEQIKSGLKKAKWPARLQKITSGKFFEILPKNFELYLDGSHNLQGASTVKEFLKTKKERKIFVVFAMLKDKDCAEFLEIIAPEIDELIAIEILGESRSRSAAEIFEIAQKLKIKSGAAKNFFDAFAKIQCKEDALILVCGSLYLAGSFLEINQSQQ